MSRVAELQSNLARTVQRRMEQIDTLVNGNVPRRSQRLDPEVEYWKKKIAALSVPVTDSRRKPAPPIRSRRYVLPRTEQRHPKLPDYKKKRENIVAPMERLRIHRRTRKLEERSRRGFIEEADALVRRSYEERKSSSNNSSRYYSRTNYHVNHPETNSSQRNPSKGGSLCTGCFEFMSDCRCGNRNRNGGSNRPALCRVCFDVPCVCTP